jgi:ABC-type antimicrobial peptide transport system permease subunit
MGLNSAGTRLVFGLRNWGPISAEIVGIVKNSKYRSVSESIMPTIYYPLAQAGMGGQVTVEVRAATNPMALLPEMQLAIHNLDPNLPLQNSMTQSTQFEKSYVTPKLFARLTLGFGALAIVLVATGLYGTLMYRLQRRRGEIGIRIALGALRGSVLRMILRESLLIAAAGFAIGLPLSLAASHLLRSQLYQLSYLDPTSFITAMAVTLLAAISASLLPARQASRMNPMEALRTE